LYSIPFMKTQESPTANEIEIVNNIGGISSKGGGCGKSTLDV